jgi:Tol biopolymer transport system component
LTNESSDLFLIGSDGENLIRLTNTPFWERDAVFGPAGRIIFVSDEDNPEGELYAINKDGGGLQRLAPGLGLTCELGVPTSSYRPSFSANRDRFVFSADASGKRGLYLWQTYDRPPKQLTHSDSKDFFPLFTADGRTVVCMRLSQGPGSAAASLVQISISDGSTKTLLDDGLWRIPVALSGGGRSVDLLVMSKQATFSIWGYGLEDGSLRRLTQNDAHIGEVVSCSPHRLVVVGDFVRPYAYEIHSIAIDGAASLKRLTTDGGYKCEPSCSPDGEWLVYVDADKRGLGSIMVMPSHGGAARVLCANHFDID